MDNNKCNRDYINILVPYFESQTHRYKKMCFFNYIMSLLAMDKTPIVSFSLLVISQQRHIAINILLFYYVMSSVTMDITTTILLYLLRILKVKLSDT